MKSILTFIVALAVTLGEPNPSPTNTYPAAWSFDHNEQGGLRKWEIKADAASTTVGVSDVLFAKFPIECNPSSACTISITIEYQAKLIDVWVDPSQTIAWLGGVQLTGDFGTIDLPSIPLHTTPGNGEVWITMPPIVVAGTFAGSELDDADFALSFLAVQNTDSLAFVNVKARITVTEH